MKVNQRLSAVILALVVSAFVAGCGGGSESEELRIGNIGWDENTVVANLAKILLEEDIGYENVQIQQTDLGPMFEGVRTGDIDVFPDVWLPNHQVFLDDVQEDVELLPVWYEDTTQFGLAAPAYMGISSIEDLNSIETQEIIGIEPGAIITNRINDYVIPEYGLSQDQQNQATAAMLSEVNRRYQDQEEVVFVAWRPHRMNDDFDFVYLEDPGEALGDLGKQSEVRTVANNSFGDNFPEAYTLLSAMRLNEEQIVDMELEVENANNDAEQGVRNWLENNRAVVQPWVDAAMQAQEA